MIKPTLIGEIFMDWVDQEKNDLRIEGCRSRSDTRYYFVTKDGAHAFVPAHIANSDLRQFCRILANRGILVPPGRQFRELQDMVSREQEFSPRNLVDGYGWHSDCFVLASGEVIAHAGQAPEVAVPLTPGKCAMSGSLRQWKHHVAAPLAGQPLLQAPMLAAFASPLLAIYDRSLPLTFELFGAASANLELATMVVSSVCGSPARNGGYGTDFGAGVDDPADVFSRHADLPLVFTAADMFAASVPPKRLAEGYVSVICRTSGTASAAASSFALLTTKEPLVVAFGDGPLADMAQIHQVVLTVGQDRQYGIFDRLPKGFESAQDAAAALDTAARRYHGTAIRSYLEQLVAARFTSEGALRKLIVDNVLRFRAAANVDLNDQAEVRVADAFGLLFAAGRLAQRYEVLPANWRIGPSLMRCYREHRWHQVPSAPLVDRLRALAASDEVVDLSANEDAAFPEAAADARMYVKHTIRGTELLIRQDAIASVLPDHKTLLVKPSSQALMKREGTRLVTQRTIGAEKKVRVYCFVLPAQIQ